MTRIVLPGLAVCWLAVALSAWGGRRRDVVRRAPLRWHRAVATLRDWSAEADGPPAAATWCRPLVQPVVVSARDLPQQRRPGASEVAAGLSLSRRP